MLIREFTEINELKDVDLVDDLHFFIQNDPKFYRKVFFPLLRDFKSKVKNGESCKDTMFRPCVDTAANIYCQKFNIPGNDKSVFTDVDRDELARKIFGQEKDRIEHGDYDRREQ
jgi:hypothetical protein